MVTQRKVLAPLDVLDESKICQEFVGLLQRKVTPDDEVILLYVIGTENTLARETKRSDVTEYLRDAVKAGGESSRWRYEIVADESISQGIVGFAEVEKVDQIVMCAREHKGLAKLFKGGIVKDVQRRATIEVRVFTPEELASA